MSYVIGQSNYFGFGFTTLKRKPLYEENLSFIQICYFMNILRTEMQKGTSSTLDFYRS